MRGPLDGYVGMLLPGAKVREKDFVARDVNVWAEVRALETIDVWTFRATYSDGSSETMDVEEVYNVKRPVKIPARD